MTRRQAKIVAHRIAWKVIDQDIGVSDWGDGSYSELPAEDRVKITAELDAISQSLYNRLKTLEERGERSQCPLKTP